MDQAQITLDNCYDPIFKEFISHFKRHVPGDPLVLLVEDDLDQRRLFGALIQNWGFRVLAVESADEASDELYTGTNPDLIVTDVNMPQVDGYSLIQFIRSTPRYASLPIIVLTATRTDAVEWTNEAHGPDMFCLKSEALRLLEGQIRFLLT